MNLVSNICFCIFNTSNDDGGFPFFDILPDFKNIPVNSLLSNMCFCNTNTSNEFISPSPFTSPYTTNIYLNTSLSLLFSSFKISFEPVPICSSSFNNLSSLLYISTFKLVLIKFFILPTVELFISNPLISSASTFKLSSISNIISSLISFTVTLHFACTSSSLFFAIISAVPIDFARITPFVCNTCYICISR